MVIDANLRTPEKLFQLPARYVVPLYQRRYVWENQWEPLWEDIRKLAEDYLKMTDGGRQEIPEEEGPSHFLGAVVLQRESKPAGDIDTRRVIDGQQRLTTLQLLLAATQAECERAGDNPKKLRTLVLNGDEHIEEDDHQFKVWPTLRDQEAFRHVIDANLSTDGYEDTLIAKCYDYFGRVIRSWVSQQDSDADSIQERAKAIRYAVSLFLQIVVIDLDQNADPQMIFETLNARGEPLLQADLIKNYLIHRAQSNGMDESDFHRDYLAKFEDRWWDEEVRQGRIRRHRIDQFLNYWLAMRLAEEVQSRDMFKKFQDYTSAIPSDPIRSVSEDIGRLASVYRGLEQKQASSEVLSFLKCRDALDLGILTPPLFWLMSSNLPAETVHRSLLALKSFVVRRSLCGKYSTGLNLMMHELVRRLTDEGPTSHSDDVLIDFLREQRASQRIWPSDSELLQSFLIRPQTMARPKVVMILENLEDQLTSGKAETVARKLSVEHIMPRVWKAHWPAPVVLDQMGDPMERRKDLINTMGNLTLVTQPLNAAMSNGPWAEKREALADHSTLFLNKDLLEHAPEDTQWDEDAILARGQRLYEAALKVWPGPDAI